MNPAPSSKIAPRSRSDIEINGVGYRWPLRPVVVVCIDVGDPAYLRRYLAEGCIPHIARFVREGHAAVIDGTMPSFTCPNNMSVITGTRGARHGISGNLYLDTATWQAVMADPEVLRGDSILPRPARAWCPSPPRTGSTGNWPRGWNCAKATCPSRPRLPASARWSRTASPTPPPT